MASAHCRRLLRCAFWSAHFLLVLVSAGVANGQANHDVAPAGTQSRTQPAPGHDWRVPDAVCSYLTGTLRAAVPTVPTLCQPIAEGDAAGARGWPMVAVSVFSPSEVLEGKMRRAWSTALFQAVQALFYRDALGGVCGVRPAPGCEIRFSDASSSDAGIFYRIHGAVPGLKELEGDLASDCNYIDWWEMSERVARNEAELSKREMESLAEGACKSFQRAIEQWPLVVREPLPVPGCDVMLATDRKIYVVVDFPDWLTAAVFNYLVELPDTFGRAFGRTEYDGQVIFRSPWNEQGRRTFVIHDIAQLAVWFDEKQAGDIYRCAGRVRMPGAEDRGSAYLGASDGAIVAVKPIPGTDRVLIDLTSGSEWSVAAAEATKAALQAGREVFVTYETRTPSDHHPQKYNFLLADGRYLAVEYVGAW